MESILSIIFIIILLLVIALLIYSLILIFKVKKISKQNQQARDKRLTHILNSIDYINDLVSAKQLDLAEASIRLNALLKPLNIDISNYPSLYEIYKIVGKHAIGKQINSIAKADAKKEKFERLKIQAEHAEKAKEEIQNLTASLKKSYHSKYFNKK